MTQTTENNNTLTSSNAERFPCCITIEEISVNIFSPLTSTPYLLNSYWDEMRIVITRDGITQRTRWLSPNLAIREIQKSLLLHSQNNNNNNNNNNNSEMMELKWSPINTSAFTVYFRYLEKEIDNSLDPGYQRQVYSNNLKYLDSYNTDKVDRNRRKVCPKTMHPFYFSVECRNVNKEILLIKSGGEFNEKKPTSANVEAVSAYYAKGASLMSSLFKKATAKINLDYSSSFSSATAEVNHRVHEKKITDRQAVQKEFNNNKNYNNNNNEKISSAFYICEEIGVDPSEAYNAIGGKQKFSLKLYPTNSQFPINEVGVPLILNFTMITHIIESPSLLTIPPIRNYHSMVILIDQIILDVMNTEERKKNILSKDNSEFKFVEAYGFGFTSNTSKTKNESFLRSPFISPPPLREGEEGGVRLIDFASLHVSHNEHELTNLDFIKNPTSICIVSSECKVGTKKRIGNRAISVSRFKTSLDGLCKPSYKCQLIMNLIRRYNTGEIEEESCVHPIDLASIINQEYYPEKIRQITFSQGEYMNFRIRRCCFMNSEYYRSELLLPYDYDNSGIQEEDLGNNVEGDVVNFSLKDLTKINKEEEDKKYNNIHEIQEEEKKKESTIRLTDSALISYNNYENQSYQPPLRVSSETNNNNNNIIIINNGNSNINITQKSEVFKKDFEISRKNETYKIFTSQREEINPFMFNSTPSHSFIISPEIINNNNNNNNKLSISNRLVNPFEEKSGVYNFVSNNYNNEEERKEEKENEGNSLPVISFHPTIVEESNSNNVTSLFNMGTFSFQTENQSKVEVTPMFSQDN